MAMKKQLLCFLASAVAVAAGADAQAQTVRLERVPALKSHFITATKSFTVELIVDNITGCTGINMNLRFTLGGAVRFSGFEEVDISSQFGGFIRVEDKSNVVAGQGNLTITATTGEKPEVGAGLTGPITVCRLNFVVTPEAVHNTNVAFTFLNPEAVVSAGDGSIIKLIPQASVYNIRGFVDVWPGDANNDRIVDSRDISIVQLFLDEGGVNDRITGYRREPASAVWAAQRALAWDSVRVTYADCDGSGRVDVNDILVVLAHIDRVHALATPPPRPPVQKKEQYAELPLNSVLIPVTLSGARQGVGVSMELDWAEALEGWKVVDVRPGEVFGSQGFFWRDDKSLASGSTRVVVGTLDRSHRVLNGTVAYLVAQRTSESAPELQPRLATAIGITNGGYMFDALSVTSVDEELPFADRLPEGGIAPQPASGGQVTVSLPSWDVQSIAVIDVAGRMLMDIAVTQGSATAVFSVDELPTGRYSVVLHGNDGRKESRPLIITR